MFARIMEFNMRRPMKKRSAACGGMSHKKRSAIPLQAGLSDAKRGFDTTSELWEAC